MRKGSMKKIFGVLILFLLFSGCTQSLAFLGPASTSVTGGSLAQKAASSSISYGVKNKTGKSWGKELFSLQAAISKSLGLRYKHSY